jgi:hypothetical protein
MSATTGRKRAASASRRRNNDGRPGRRDQRLVTLGVHRSFPPMLGTTMNALETLESTASVPLVCAESLKLARDFAKAARSAATRRAYSGDIAIFVEWCRSRQAESSARVGWRGRRLSRRSSRPRQARFDTWAPICSLVRHCYRQIAAGPATGTDFAQLIRAPRSDPRKNLNATRRRENRLSMTVSHGAVVALKRS